MAQHLMEKEVHKIHIIPARFIEKRNDRYLIRCLIGETFEDRLFDHFALEGIKNPNLLFIGVMTGVGYSQINFCRADEFEDLFKKHWKEVL